MYPIGEASVGGFMFAGGQLASFLTVLLPTNKGIDSIIYIGRQNKARSDIHSNNKYIVFRNRFYIDFSLKERTK